MTQTPLSAAVVGGGFIGRMHARVYAELPSVNSVGIVDIDVDVAAETAEEYDAWHATDLESALREHNVDVVSVATPEAHHLGPTVTALEQDCTVLLEKPIAEDVEDATAIGDAVANSEGTVAIGYLLRFHPEYAALKRRIDAGDIGEVISMQADRIRDRGMYQRAGQWTNPVYYLTVHDVDMMRWYTGAEVEEVYAVASRSLDSIDEPSVVSATLEFDDGTTASIQSNWARTAEHPAYRTDRIQVTGTTGFAEKRERANVQLTTNEGTDYKQPIELHGRAIGALRYQLEDVVECARTGKDPLVTWEDGLESLVVGNAVLDAIEQGKPVSVDSRR